MGASPVIHPIEPATPFCTSPPRLAVSVVLPTPPLVLVIAATRLIRPHPLEQRPGAGCHVPPERVASRYR